MSEHQDHTAIYKKVFITLMVLTCVTVLVSRPFWGFGVGFGIFIGLAIAIVKASMVAMYFMHLKFEVKSTWALVAIPMALLLLLMFALMPDIAGVI